MIGANKKGCLIYSMNGFLVSAWGRVQYFGQLLGEDTDTFGVRWDRVCLELGWRVGGLKMFLFWCAVNTLPFKRSTTTFTAQQPSIALSQHLQCEQDFVRTRDISRTLNQVFGRPKPAAHLRYTYVHEHLHAIDFAFTSPDLRTVWRNIRPYHLGGLRSYTYFRG